MRYNWPGNIRELENTIERAILLADGRAIAGDDLRLGEVATAGGGRDHAAVVKIPPTGIPLEDIERHALIEALKMSNWVQKDAAELLSISPRVMNYKIKTLGIEFPRGTPGGAPHAAGSGGLVDGLRDSRKSREGASSALPGFPALPAPQFARPALGWLFR